MIKKSFITGLIILIAYTVFVELNPEINFHPHLWQGNLVKAQQFIYDDKETASGENIIVGSSLAARIEMDSIPGFYNLAFPGLTAYDGLKILQNTNISPKSIYIEANGMLKQENKNFINSLFHPIFFYSAKYIPPMRTRKQPVGVFIEYLRHLSDFQAGGNDKPTEAKTFDLLFQEQEKEYSWYPNDNQINTKADLLAEYVTYFESRGVKIYFFEMPINYQLATYPYAVAVRKSIREKFPPEQYCYMASDTSKYHTTDGIHLNKQEAARYTHFFKTHLPKANDE